MIMRPQDFEPGQTDNPIVSTLPAQFPVATDAGAPIYAMGLGDENNSDQGTSTTTTPSVGAGGNGILPNIDYSKIPGSPTVPGYYNYVINLLKRQTDQAALDRAAKGTAAQAAYLRSQLGQGVPQSVINAIEAQRTAGEQYIFNQEKALLDLLNRRYGLATGVTGTAYGALRDYLSQNAPTAYAQAERAVPQTYQTALGQYMAGQGVSPQVAQTAAEVQNVLGAGGAANYNQLLNVLAAREAATQQSRLAEAEMARTGALTGLENLYAGSQFQVQQQRLAGLAELANRISAAKIAAEQQAAARDVALQNALATLIGTGYDVTSTQTPAQTPAQTTAGLTPLQQLQRLTVNAPTRNPTLASRVAKLARTNPNATVAQIQRQFPQLGRRIR